MYSENKKKGLCFRPTVLVDCFGERQGEGLMDEAHMEGLVMQKCSGRDIYCSNAFMVDTRKQSDIVTEKYYRIQDKVFFHAFATICRNKEFCEEGACQRNDAIAAEFILENKEETIYKGLEQIAFVQDSKKRRNGIHYICPMTKLDEIAFPVRLYNRRMGVLIVGQVTTPTSKAALEACIREKLPETVEKGDEGETAESAIRKIKVIKNLQELVDKISDTVDDIEKGLIEYYKERQKQYVLEKSDELIENFKSEIEKMENEGNSAKLVYPAAAHMEYYTSIGECIKKQLKELCGIIGVKGKIFIPNSDNLAKNQYGTIEGEDNSVFYFDVWKRDKRNNNVCDNAGKYMEGIEKKFDFLLVADTLTYPIVLAVCQKDFLTGIENEEKKLLWKTFNEVFNKFAEYSQMAGMEAKSDYYRAYLDSYMSIQRHEIGQSNAGYQMLIEEFKKQRNIFSKELDEHNLKQEAKGIVKDYIKHCDNFIRDSRGYLNTTMLRIQSTKYLIDFSDVRKTYFYPYDAFLFKWNHIYGVRAEKENLQFNFPEVNDFDFTRPRMYGDPMMIEQAAYNLTNNAIKYAMFGSTVSLDCYLNEESGQYVIQVENIGVPLKEDIEVERIFEFGKRGSNNKKEGSGLGLFLTKQIAEAHGGGVKCKMERFSEYNWTLIQLYIRYYKDVNIKHLCKDKELYECLENEWKEKSKKISFHANADIPDTAFTPLYVHQNIRKGTAKFKFTFWIPYEKE